MLKHALKIISAFTLAVKDEIILCGVGSTRTEEKTWRKIGALPIDGMKRHECLISVWLTLHAGIV